MFDVNSPIVPTAEGLVRGSLTPKLDVYKGIRQGENTSEYRFFRRS